YFCLEHYRFQPNYPHPETSSSCYKYPTILPFQTIKKQSITTSPSNSIIIIILSTLSRNQIATMSLIPSMFGGRRNNILDPFSMDIWDPFSSFSSSALSNTSNNETSAFANARIDWKETPEAHIFKADLPGLKKEEVKVEVEEDRVLQLSGERSREHEEKNDKWHRMERSSGKFVRRFRLPDNAKMDQIKASMENGVLTVTVPKEEQKKPQVKAIDISG
ncbi:hypothetical protein Leryth_004116, partial [Lithospermum erythrorhizon]